jgi:hypothetical protein
MMPLVAGRTTRDWKEYQVWCYIKSRCYNKKVKAFKYYGGRGITMCDRWRNSFAAFLEDMGQRPTPKHQIDRIDNEKGYEPGNCRWATKKEQMRNRSNSRLVTAKGKTQCVATWAEETGLSWDVIWMRLRLGWSDERAVTVPKRKHTKPHAKAIV